MEHLFDIISNYVKVDNRETSILINGKWGSGKTYYIKNTLIKQISDSLNIKSFYVSVNGVSSFEEISDRILLSVIGLLDEHKVGWGIVKSAYKFGTSENLGGKIGLLQSIAKYFSGNVKVLKLQQSLKDCILFIDDLERVSRNLNIEDVLGYVCSNYLEASKTKVVFICNEDEIDDKEKYKKVKEKTISKTIEFKPTIKDIFDSFISSPAYKKNNLFQKFFIETKEVSIEMLYKAEITNLRTIQSILDIFHIVSSCINTDTEMKYLISIFRFIVAIQNEYAFGFLPVEDKKTMDSLRLMDFNRLFGRKNRYSNSLDSEPDYFDVILSKYNEGSEAGWVFYESIYNYILSFYLDKKLLQEEIKKQVGEHSIEVDALNGFHNIYYLDTEDEVLRVLKNLKEFISKDSYSVRDLYNIYTNTNFLQNSGINTEVVNEIENLIIEKFKVIIQNYSDPFELSEMYNDISMFGINENFKKEIEPYYRRALLKAQDAYKTNTVVNFFEALEGKSGGYTFAKEMIISKNIFKQIVDCKMEDRVNTLSAKAIMSLRSAINNSILKVSNAGEFHVIEVDPLNDIINSLSKNMDKDSWKRNLQQMLITTLQESVTHITNTSGR